MKKILAICALLMMGGCAAVKQAGSDAINTVSNPPSQVIEMLKQIGEWLVNVLVTFFHSVYSSFGL
jgi:hypothetical protein